MTAADIAAGVSLGILYAAAVIYAFWGVGRLVSFLFRRATALVSGLSSNREGGRRARVASDGTR